MAASLDALPDHDFDAVASIVKLDIASKTQDADNEKKRKEITRSFISDTVTVPSPEMYEYATRLSTLGDDVYFEPSTAILEAHVAKILGKEAGLFVPSGTASNQIALRTHLKQPPYSVLADSRSHILNYESGGTAFLSGAHTIPVVPSNKHHLTLQDVKDNIIISDDVHFAPTEVIELENTLNGGIFPQDEIIAISAYAHSLGLKVHLDGARIWHVAAETKTPLAELCAPVDSVSVCFSKGLGAPVGSVLVGTKAFIKRARHFRRILGGGMRQTGVLAGCAAYALTHNFPSLPRVHALTKRLQKGLEDLGCKILIPGETCMIFYDPSPLGITFDDIASRASALPSPLFLSGTRLVLHIQTSEEAVTDLLGIIAQLAQEKKNAGIIVNGVTEDAVVKDVYAANKAGTAKKD